MFRVSLFGLVLLLSACGGEMSTARPDGGGLDSGSAADAGLPPFNPTGTGTLTGDFGFEPSLVVELLYTDAAGGTKQSTRARVIRFFGPDAGVSCDGGTMAIGTSGLDVFVDRTGKDAGFVGTFRSFGEYNDVLYTFTVMDGGIAANAQNIQTTLTIDVARPEGMQGSFDSKMAALDFSRSGQVSGTFSAPYCPALRYW